MKWKIYSWTPWIKLAVLTICMGFYFCLMVSDLAQNGTIKNQPLFDLLFCLVIPAGLEQISRIIDTQAGAGNYKDERERHLKLEAGYLAFKYAKIFCVALLCISALLNYSLASVLFTGIMLGLGIFLVIMYVMENILYFYCEKIK